MARKQTLVQLSDEIVGVLDAIARDRGRSRSELIREALETHYRDAFEAEIDRRIVEGYRRIPPTDLGGAAGLDHLRRMNAEDPW